MPDEYRVTIRLSPELYEQLTRRGSHGQPLTALIRQALTDYLAQPDNTPPTLAAMAASLDALRRQVQRLTARLDALAAGWHPLAAAPLPRGQTKLTPVQVAEMRGKREAGVPMQVLMQEYGISRATVFRYLK
jgi:response regulator of citrate/malate metabolism